VGDGALEVEAFGRKMSCPVCGNGAFCQNSTTLNTGMLHASEMVTLNYTCSRCGYILWFSPKRCNAAPESCGYRRR
jgi:C4-type Zn-finger protein